MSPNSKSPADAGAVRELITEMSPLGRTGTTPETKLVEDLGFDSLGLVELLVVIEDQFDLPPFDEHALVGMERVADLERIVTDAQAQAPLG